MYTYTSQTHANISFGRIFKFLAVVLGLGYGAAQLTDRIHSSPTITASGECFPLEFPYSSNLVLSSPNGQTAQMKSLWKVQLRNGSSQDASGLVVELPFSGFYKIHDAGKESILQNFTKSIRMETIPPLGEVSLLIWSDSEMSQDLARETRLVLNNAVISIDYPVQLTGILAWMERSQVLLILLLTLFLLFLIL